MLNKRAIYYQVSYTFCFNCLISVHTAFPERGLLGMHGYSACKDCGLPQMAHATSFFLTITGDIIVVNTNKWVHSTSVLEDLSITITNEYM